MMSITARAHEADQGHMSSAISCIMKEMEQSPDLGTSVARHDEVMDTLEQLNMRESELARQYEEALLLSEVDPARGATIEALLTAHLEVISRKIGCYRQMNEVYGLIIEEAEQVEPDLPVPCDADARHGHGKELRHWMQATGMVVTLLRAEWDREHRLLSRIRRACLAVQ